MSSGPEAERAVGVSTAGDDRLGHTLVLLLSRKDIPDTSRKPGEESSSVLWESGSLSPPAMFPEHLT